MVNIQAINNYVVFEEIKGQGPDKETGLVLPDSVKKEPRWGKVLSVGPGLPDFNGRFVPVEAHVGDVIYVNAHGKEKIPLSQLGGSDVHIASVLDVLGMVDQDTLDFTPYGDLIVIEKIEPAREVAGIRLADSMAQVPAFGKVLRLGLGWMSAEGAINTFQCKVGDTISYLPHMTQVVDYVTLGHTKKVDLVKHGNVLGVVETA